MKRQLDEWEQEASKLGLLDVKAGRRVSCLTGKQHCQRVVTENGRHKPGSMKHCPMCGFIWSMMRQHVRSGEVFEGEEDMEDTSLEEALRDFNSRRSCDINFQAGNSMHRCLVGAVIMWILSSV